LAQPWILSIDFGTSYTLVAAKVGDRPPEVVEIGGERRMPSVVLVEQSGSIVVGRTADDLSGSNPANTLRAPKNRLGDQAPVVLGGRPYQVVQLVAALLRTVYDEAVAQIGDPPIEVRLTHPATWNRPRLNRLLEAAAKAGLPNPALVPEPVAAALSYASESGVPEGGHLVVYDLGGGTFDTAVVTARRGGFEVEGRPGGDQNIGGELFDELVMNHVGEQLASEAWEQIQVADEPTWQQVGASLRREARRAKETLSSHPYADLLLPLPDGLVQQRITRDEFEQIVGPYIDETVTLLRRCINDAGVDESKVASIYLVGGASRSPIVERLVRGAFPGVAVSRRGDPKTSVALGAARAVRSGRPSTSGASRTTQEASPNTADEPLLLGPPSGPDAPGRPSQPGYVPPVSDPGAGSRPTTHPGQPASDPGAAARSTSPVSDPGAASRRTPFPPQPAGPTSQPSNPPAASHTSHPPSSSAGHTSAPPTVTEGASIRPAAGIAGAGSGVGAAAPPYLAGGPGASPPGRVTAQRRWSPKMLALVAAAAVAAGALVGFIVLQASDSGSDGSDRTTTVPEETTVPDGELPTQEELDAELLTRSQVAESLTGASWSEITDLDPTLEGDTFCDFTAPVKPSVSALTGYASAEGDLEVYVRIDQFTDAQDALRALGHDQSVAANCTGPRPYTLFGEEFTAELFDATAQIGEAIGNQSAAVGYRIVPPDGRDDLVELSGYILEWRRGSHIVTVELSGVDRLTTEDENNQFSSLVAAYYLQTAGLS
jgi:actin-like ATPase involved in cell morphogenesis